MGGNRICRILSLFPSPPLSVRLLEDLATAYQPLFPALYYPTWRRRYGQIAEEYWLQPWWLHLGLNGVTVHGPQIRAGNRYFGWWWVPACHSDWDIVLAVCSWIAWTNSIRPPILVQGAKTTMLGVEGWIRIEVRPIFSLFSLLLLPFCQPYIHLIYSPCFTLQKALSSPFPHCSFHLSVNPIFNLSTVLVSPVFTLSSLLLSPFCQPYIQPIYSACFTLQ